MSRLANLLLGTGPEYWHATYPPIGRSVVDPTNGASRRKKALILRLPDWRVLHDYWSSRLSLYARDVVPEWSDRTQRLMLVNSLRLGDDQYDGMHFALLVAHSGSHVYWRTARFIPLDHGDVLESYALYIAGALDPKLPAKKRIKQVRLDKDLLERFRPHRMAPLPGGGLARTSTSRPEGVRLAAAAITAQLAVLYPRYALSDEHVACAAALSSHMAYCHVHRRSGPHLDLRDAHPGVDPNKLAQACWAPSELVEPSVAWWNAVASFRKRFDAIKGFADGYQDD